MKPAPFEYSAPDTLEEAISLLEDNEGDAKVLSGGQSLMPLLNMRLARPEVLVDLARIPNLDYVRQEDGDLVIGAMTRQRTVELDPLVRERHPLVYQATMNVAHPQKPQPGYLRRITGPRRPIGRVSGAGGCARSAAQSGGAGWRATDRRRGLFRDLSDDGSGSVGSSHRGALASPTHGSSVVVHGVGEAPWRLCVGWCDLVFLLWDRREMFLGAYRSIRSRCDAGPRGQSRAGAAG